MNSTAPTALCTDAAVRVRAADRTEISIGSTSPFLRVVEPRGRIGPADTRRWFRRNADGLVALLREHAAVLIRGFGIDSPRRFEQALAEVKPLHAMSTYLMLEPGRETLPGTRTVWCTNRNIRTGGGLALTGFHTENYYSPQVPSFVAFACLSRPWLGGETAVVRMDRVFAQLDADLQERLRDGPFLASVIAVEEAARRQRLSPAVLRQRLDAWGLPRVERDGIDYLATFKPAVIEHPADGRPSLLANVSAEVPGLDAFIGRRLQPHFSRRRWAIHRKLWRSSRCRRALSWLTDPRGSLCRARASVPPAAPARGETSQPLAARLARAFVHRIDVEQLAEAMMHHCVAVRWRRGDVLLFDNFRTTHAGMPGFGPRELAVQMYDPAIIRAHDTRVARVPPP
ncbi:MAG: TauD/TfdA family dioxygenase [Deltaproteobacteria bacterium]|nr:TauD/TfdA family dioxygenase [Deltaproteobacteria bacterium]